MVINRGRHRAHHRCAPTSTSFVGPDMIYDQASIIWASSNNFGRCSAQSQSELILWTFQLYMPQFSRAIQNFKGKLPLLPVRGAELEARLPLGLPVRG